MLINSARVVGYESIYDFKNKKSRSADLYRRVFETNVWSLLNVLDFDKQTVIVPDISYMMRRAAIPDSDPVCTPVPVENSMLVPTVSTDLRAGILALLFLSKENLWQLYQYYD